MKTLFVTGGTGLLGRKLLEVLPADRFKVILGTRRTLPDTDKEQRFFDLEQQGLNLDLTGIDIIIHLASHTQQLNAEWELNGIRQLLLAADKFQVAHLIYLSIVGVETVPVKYFRTKRKVEQILAASSIPYTILRSTQFFEFFENEIQQKLQRKIVITPNLRYQPIEVEKVAHRVIQLMDQSPLYGTIEIGGVETIDLVQAIHLYQQQNGGQSWVLGIPTKLLGSLGTALTTSHQIKSGTTWLEYLQGKKSKNR